MLAYNLYEVKVSQVSWYSCAREIFGLCPSEVPRGWWTDCINRWWCSNQSCKFHKRCSLCRGCFEGMVWGIFSLKWDLIVVINWVYQRMIMKAGNCHLMDLLVAFLIRRQETWMILEKGGLKRYLLLFWGALMLGVEIIWKTGGSGWIRVKKVGQCPKI